MTGTPERPDTLRGKPGVPMIGLLVVEMIVGYEWFISGLVKIMRGNFPSGLAGESRRPSSRPMSPRARGVVTREDTLQGGQSCNRS